MAHILPFKGIYPTIHHTAVLADTAVIIGDVTLGPGVSIWPNAVIRGDFSAITVGAYTNIQDNVTVHSDIRTPHHIGDHVLIGHNAIIHGQSIGAGALIGMGAVLMSYSSIGENPIIGAGTIITQGKQIPADSLVYGNPFRIIRSVTEEEKEETRKEVEAYHQLSLQYPMWKGSW